MVEGNQLPDATTVVSLAILLSNAGATQMPKIPVPKVGAMATKAMAIKAMVLAMVGVMGRLMIGPITWMPMHRGI